MSIVTAETSLSLDAIRARNQRLGIIAMIGQTTMLA